MSHPQTLDTIIGYTIVLAILSTALLLHHKTLRLSVITVALVTYITFFYIIHKLGRYVDENTDNNTKTRSKN